MIGRKIAATLVLFSATSGTAHAAPTEQVHNLDWFVHQCLIDASGLTFYQTLINDRLEEASKLVQGLQGPADTACCVELADASVSAFGTCGDGLDVITTQAELDALKALGDGAYLVESLHYCTSFSPSIRGCATKPGDFLAAGREADDSYFLATVMAHERGHNSNLSHVFANSCELMSGSSGGGCLASSECSAFIAKADATGGTCDCLGDNVGDPVVAVGTSCTNLGGVETCSAGLCGTASLGSEGRIMVAGGTGSPTGGTPDDALEQSVIAGHWSSLGNFGSGVEITGLAYDSVGDVLYGIESSVGNDTLVTIDTTTGMTSGTIGAVTGSNVIALTYDEDSSVLYGIQFDATIFGGPVDCVTSFGFTPCVSSVIQIDPSDASTTFKGSLNGFIVQDGVQGLAYDHTRDDLYGSSAAGLITIDLSSCNGSSCGSTQIDNDYFLPSSLTYDEASDRIIRQGSTTSVDSTIDYFDPVSGASEIQRGIDVYTAGGAAALPVPEPRAVLSLLTSAAFVAALARRRRRMKSALG